MTSHICRVRMCSALLVCRLQSLSDSPLLSMRGGLQKPSEIPGVLLSSFTPGKLLLLLHKKQETREAKQNFEIFLSSWSTLWQRKECQGSTHKWCTSIIRFWSRLCWGWFACREGNWDLVGNNFPVFFVRDGMKFPDMVHALKPNPKNHIQEGWRIADFFSHHPEAMHMVGLEQHFLSYDQNAPPWCWDSLVQHTSQVGILTLCKCFPFEQAPQQCYQSRANTYFSSSKAMVQTRLRLSPVSGLKVGVMCSLPSWWMMLVYQPTTGRCLVLGCTPTRSSTARAKWTMSNSTGCQRQASASSHISQFLRADITLSLGTDGQNFSDTRPWHYLLLASSSEGGHLSSLFMADSIAQALADYRLHKGLRTCI